MPPSCMHIDCHMLAEIFRDLSDSSVGSLHEHDGLMVKNGSNSASMHWVGELVCVLMPDLVLVNMCGALQTKGRTPTKSCHVLPICAPFSDDPKIECLCCKTCAAITIGKSL